MAVQTFAAIAVGSFELELGIYELSARNGLRRVDQVRHVIGLGRDTYSTGKISYRLVDEMCRILEDFVQIMNTYKVKDYRAYATSAMREAKNNQIVLDQIRIDRTARRVSVCGEEIAFTTKEFDLLVFLASHPNRVFSKEELFREVWGMHSIGDVATVTVHIKKIRQKLEKYAGASNLIETVWGAGYRFQMSGSIRVQGAE